MLIDESGKSQDSSFSFQIMLTPGCSQSLHRVVSGSSEQHNHEPSKHCTRQDADIAFGQLDTLMLSNDWVSHQSGDYWHWCRDIQGEVGSLKLWRDKPGTLRSNHLAPSDQSRTRIPAADHESSFRVYFLLLEARNSFHIPIFYAS